MEETRTTLAEFASDLGVTKQRIHRLKQEGRIDGWEVEENGTITLPAPPRIRRGRRMRPGVITSYIEESERELGIDPRDNVVSRG
jgi:hypothetical protein